MIPIFPPFDRVFAFFRGVRFRENADWTNGVRTGVSVRIIPVLLGVITLLAISSGSIRTVNGQWITQDDLMGPFIDSAPFDVIYLNDQGQNAIMKVRPLGDAFPSQPLPNRGELIFEYLISDGDRLVVPFSSIKEIRSFNDLLIEEANRWIAEGKFSVAFRNLFQVYNNGGKDDADMVESLKDCMYLDGAENFKVGEYELALSIFEDFLERTPDFIPTGIGGRTLAEIVMTCYDGIINRQFENADYVGVRLTLETIVEKYGDDAGALEQKWKGAFQKRSDDLLAEAKRLADAGSGRMAHHAAKQADQMMPDRPEVLAYQEELLLQFPLIVVGVSQTTSHPDPVSIADWAARRVGKLTQRRMLEITGLTDEGGKYEFLNGSLTRTDELGREYTFEIKNDVTRFAVPSATAFDVSMRLLLLADKNSPSFSSEWAKIVGKISILDENRVAVTLKTPFIRPEALLKTTYSDSDDETPIQNGPYVIATLEKDIAIFELNPDYPRRPNQQHPVIVEQLFTAASTAVDQLKMGNIDLVDRIPISDIDALKADPKINVGSYLLPTVHMLVPKIRGELADSGHFRNGLSHAIDRELLVHKVICGGTEIDGCEAISGPFPIGTDDNDQISYAYDMNVRPLMYHEALSMVLIEMAIKADPPTRPLPLVIPTLVLAHPASSSASDAAEAIARMWTAVGVPAVTRKLQPGESTPPDEEWDFLYLEVTIEEPLSDAAKMLGAYGFAKDVSAPVEQTLRILSYAESWQSACSALRRLHRQISVDLTVIPLWQVKEHFAYRTTVRNVGRDLIHLYQNVDRWKIDLTAKEAEKEEPTQ